MGFRDKLIWMIFWDVDKYFVSVDFGKDYACSLTPPLRHTYHHDYHPDIFAQISIELEKKEMDLLIAFSKFVWMDTCVHLLMVLPK